MIERSNFVPVCRHRTWRYRHRLLTTTQIGNSQHGGVGRVRRHKYNTVHWTAQEEEERERKRETSTESVYLSRSIYRASHTSFWRAPEPNLAPVTGIGTSVLRRPAVFTGQQQRRKLSHRLSLTRTHHCDGQVIRVLNVLLQSSANSVHVWHCPTE